MVLYFIVKKNKLFLICYFQTKFPLAPRAKTAAPSAKGPTAASNLTPTDIAIIDAQNVIQDSEQAIMDDEQVLLKKIFNFFFYSFVLYCSFSLFQDVSGRTAVSLRPTVPRN